MLRRNKKFVPERPSIGVSGFMRLGAYALITVSSVWGLAAGLHAGWGALSSTEEARLVVLEPHRDGWKRRPEAPGGKKFLNKGLEINHVQAELFDAPKPEEIVLAPPPEDF